MTCIPLSRLLADMRPAEAPVARRGEATLTLGRLRGEVAHNVTRLAARRPRSVLLAAEDSFAFAVGLFAALHAGAAVALPSNTRPGTIAALAPAFDALVSDVPRDGVDAFVLEAVCAGDTLAPLDAGDCRLDVFTSGSTGEPKRVVKSLAMVEAETEVLERLWGREAEGADSVATVTHQHVFGLTFGLAWSLAAGRRFSATVHHTWEGLFAALTGHAVIVSSPAHLTRLAGLAPAPASHRPRLVFTAGAPLPPGAALATERLFGRAPVEIFGSTETGAIAWRRGRGQPGLWRALPGVAVEPGPDGLMRVATPFAGDAPIELADRVEVAADGRLRFAGRADGVLKIEGKRASLAELERALCALPAVAEAAVVVLPGATPLLGAAVVPSALGRAELEARGPFRFARALRGELARLHEPAVLPRRWRFPLALPIDAMGKRRRDDLVALFVPEPARVRRRA